MNTKKILVVDDNIEIANEIAACFEELGYSYIFYRAMNGISGFDIAKEKKPDLILSDWDMPGMNGIELIKRLKQEESTKTIPIIMMSGIMTSSENLKIALEAGAIDYIRKPIDKIELIARVRSMLLLANYYNETVDIKNRELTNLTLNIIHNNEFIVELQKKIMELDIDYGTKNKQLSTKLNEIKKELTIKQKKEIWQQFDNYYQQLNPNFYSNLSTLFPDITPSEIKLCALLRLNMNTKDIASLLCLETDSIKSFRYRIRKKLNLNSGENLFNFLVCV